jgi:hypothetical protein
MLTSLTSWNLPASAVGGDALVRQPNVFRQRTGLPEHVDRYPAARVPIAADAQVGGLENGPYPFADCDCAILVKAAVVAK